MFLSNLAVFEIYFQDNFSKTPPSISSLWVDEGSWIIFLPPRRSLIDASNSGIWRSSNFDINHGTPNDSGWGRGSSHDLTGTCISFQLMNILSAPRFRPIGRNQTWKASRHTSCQRNGSQLRSIPTWMRMTTAARLQSSITLCRMFRNKKKAQ